MIEELRMSEDVFSICIKHLYENKYRMGFEEWKEDLESVCKRFYQPLRVQLED